MNKEFPEITSSFFLTAECHFDPQLVTARLPIPPSYTEAKGAERPGGRPRSPQSIWCYECRNRRIQSLDEGLREVFEVVVPHRMAILGIMSDIGLTSHFQSYVRIHSKELRVVYELQSETIKRIADMDAEWIMDLYDFSE